MLVAVRLSDACAGHSVWALFLPALPSSNTHPARGMRIGLMDCVCTQISTRIVNLCDKLEDSSNVQFDTGFGAADPADVQVAAVADVSSCHAPVLIAEHMHARRCVLDTSARAINCQWALVTRSVHSDLDIPVCSCCSMHLCRFLTPSSIFHLACPFACTC